MTNPYDKNKAISADEAAKIIPRAEFRVFGKNIIAGVQEHMWKCKATLYACLLYTSPSPRDGATSRMPSSA